MDAKSKQPIIDELRVTYGDILPEHEYLIDHDWEWFRRRHKINAYVFSQKTSLSRKMKALLTAVATAARMPGSEGGRYVRMHVRHALELGATPQEILEAFECITFPVGGIAFMVGVKCLRDILEEEPHLKTNEVSESSSAEVRKAPLTRKALEEKQLKVHGYVLPEHEFIMDNDWDWTLLMHDFYDYTNTREGCLPNKMWSLVVVVALCARIPGIEGERYIRNHMGLALKAGAKPEEILEALECAYFPCGGPTLLVGVKCLREVIQEGEAGRGA